MSNDGNDLFMHISLHHNLHLTDTELNDIRDVVNEDHILEVADLVNKVNELEARLKLLNAERKTRGAL